MTLDEWNAAVRAKVDATWNLSDILGGDKMDFFIFLSSTVGITGSPEQANYAAGGTFQDGLARHLASRGVNAVSVDLPIIQGVGYVAEKPELWDYLRATGWTYITEDEFHATLDYHCRPADGPLPVGRSQVIPRLWLPQDKAAEGYEVPSWGGDPLFRHLSLTETGSVEKTETKTEVNHKALLSGAASREEAVAIVQDALLVKVSRVLSVEVSHLDVSKPLSSYGIDSLVAVEVRSWLAKELGAEVSVFDIINNSSLAQLAVTATEKSKLRRDFGES